MEVNEQIKGLNPFFIINIFPNTFNKKKGKIRCYP